MAAIFILAAALSIDAFGIGAAYGLRKIKIPVLSLAVISFTALIFSTASIIGGALLSELIPRGAAVSAGSGILIIMGLWLTIQGILDVRPIKEETTIFSLFIKSFGITVNIIKSPKYGDMDNSKVIETKEAFYLGAALSLDCFGAGAGLTVMGLPTVIYPVFIVIAQLLFLMIGISAGKKIKKNRTGESVYTVISGSVLIIIGLFRLVNP